MTDIRTLEPLFGSWYLEEEIGRGSYGNVYRAHSDARGQRRWAAIKHISVEEREDRSVQQQLRELNREININQLFLREPNIVAFQESDYVPKPGGDGLDVFLRMELLTPLNQWVRRRPMPESEVIRLGLEICKALGALENLGILHRDVKISNIFVSNTGAFKLGDFGVAKSIGSVAYGMTVTGAYNYMAPEIARGSRVLLNADLYSLGLVLFRLMNGGMAPFLRPGDDPSLEEANAAMLRRINGEALPRPANASPELTGVILQACAYEPGERYNTAPEMAEALRECEKAIRKSRSFWPF